jgi:hypothetical protein
MAPARGGALGSVLRGDITPTWAGGHTAGVTEWSLVGPYCSARRVTDDALHHAGADAYGGADVKDARALQSIGAADVSLPIVVLDTPKVRAMSVSASPASRRATASRCVAPKQQLC